MKKRHIEFNEFSKLVGNIAREIAISDWRPDYIVGITRGGLLPATMLSHYFDVPCHTLKVSLRDFADNTCESNCWMADDAYGYGTDKKKILIVDDINDSGATLNWIKSDWRSSCMPDNIEVWENIWHNTVKFACVFDNLDSKFQEVDYNGCTFDKREIDEWIVFPYEGWW